MATPPVLSAQSGTITAIVSSYAHAQLWALTGAVFPICLRLNTAGTTWEYSVIPVPKIQQGNPFSSFDHTALTHSRVPFKYFGVRLLLARRA